MAAITNEIYIGDDRSNPDFYFLNSEIVSINAVNSVDLVAEELAIDSLEAVILHHVDRGDVFTPTDASGIITTDDRPLCGRKTADLRLVPFGTPVWYYSGEQYIGKYYVDHIERIGKNQYRLYAVSLIGLFDKKPYYGGIYDSTTNTTFGSLVRDIFLGDGAQAFQGYDSARFYGMHVIRGVQGDLTGAGEKKVNFSFIYNGFGDEGYKLKAGEYNCGIWGSHYIYSATSAITIDSWAMVLAAPSGDTASQDYDGSIDVIYSVTPPGGGDPWVTSPVRVNRGDHVTVEIDNIANKFTINGHTFDQPTWQKHNWLSGTLFGVIIGRLDGSTYETNTQYQPSRLDCTFLSYSAVSALGDQVKKFPYTVIGSDTVRIFSTKSGAETVINLISEVTKRPPVPGNPIRIDQPGFVWYSQDDIDLFNKVKFDAGVAEYPVYGWLPAQTKREALYQLMFAYDVNIVKTADDSVMFTWIYASDPVEIPDRRIYDQGEVVYDSLAKRVELTEHSFIKSADTESKILYDNSDGDDQEILVTFPEPMYGLSATNLTILYSNANCAYVSGIGTLRGRAYVHGTNVKVKFNDSNPGGSTVSVTDATLVGVHNSENVMKRLYDYYTKRQTVKNGIVLDGEECGKNYAFLDPFYDRSHGYIRKMDISGSAILKADCEIITDYEPTGQGSNYSHSVLLTGSGTWTVPDEVYQKDVPAIRVFVIGGGDGGDSGLRGEDGKKYTSNSQKPAAGGGHGAHGNGGKIYSVTIENPQRQFTFSCGNGGAGGAGKCTDASVPNRGAPGGATFFGSYSSENGIASPDGITNFQNGLVYGRKYTTIGQNGNGGDGGYIETIGDLFYPLNGYAAYDYTGHDAFAGGSSAFGVVSLAYGQWKETLPGGFGGGAAVGENGKDGTKPSSNNVQTIKTGNGGDGGNATIKAPNATEWGCGGYGGYGGGAGGNTGYSVSGATMSPGTPGVGGYGGEGGDGAPGCVLIYW